MLKQKLILLAGLFISFLSSGPAFAHQQTARYIQIYEATKAFYEYLPEGYPPKRQKSTHNNGDPTVPVSVTNNFISLINAAFIPPTSLAKQTIFTITSHDAFTQTYSPSFKDNGQNNYECLLQYSENFMVLPVQGLEFTAEQVDGKKIKLQWKTASEINNLGFSVLRSSDGLSFSSIGYVNSTAVNDTGATYIYTDENPLPGKNFYRLEMNNANQPKNYSEIKTVQMPALLDLSFYPNPVQKVLNIKTAHPFNNARLRISNAAGVNVLQQTLEGNGSIAVPVASLPSGIYYGKIIENGEQLRFKFVKE